jgi:hypothetical protein
MKMESNLSSNLHCSWMYTLPPFIFLLCKSPWLELTSSYPLLLETRIVRPREGRRPGGSDLGLSTLVSALPMVLYLSLCLPPTMSADESCAWLQGSLCATHQLATNQVGLSSLSRIEVVGSQVAWFFHRLEAPKRKMPSQFQHWLNCEMKLAFIHPAKLFLTSVLGGRHKKVNWSLLGMMVAKRREGQGSKSLVSICNFTCVTWPTRVNNF